jgi:hypothetical protein
MGANDIGRTWRGLDLLIDETTYMAKDGTTQYFVPSDCVSVACSANQGRMAYAGIAQGDPENQQLEVYEGTRVPLIWLPDNEDVRKIRLASRPCPVPRSQQLDRDEGDLKALVNQ